MLSKYIDNSSLYQLHCKTSSCYMPKGAIVNSEIVIPIYSYPQASGSIGVQIKTTLTPRSEIEGIIPLCSKLRTTVILKMS